MIIKVVTKEDFIKEASNNIRGKIVSIMLNELSLINNDFVDETKDMLNDFKDDIFVISYKHNSDLKNYIIKELDDLLFVTKYDIEEIRGLIDVLLYLPGVNNMYNAIDIVILLGFGHKISVEYI